MLKNYELDSMPRDRLARGRLHKVMLLLNLPVSRPTWQLVLLALFLCLACGAIWMLPGDWRLALRVTFGQALFFLGDVLLLKLLPRRRISFGPWRAQFLALALPRFLAASGIGLLALLIDPKLAWWLFLASQFFGTLLLIWGAHVEAARLQHTLLEIRSERVASSTKPIRILHISDLHIERLSRREGQILSYLARSEPDLILITGDYLNLSFNRDPEAYRQVCSFLARLSAPQGVYAVLGTPTVDLWELVTPLFDDLPITLLRNDLEVVQWSDGRCLTLVGLDCTHDVELDAAHLRGLLTTAAPDMPVVLLYHSPELMPQAVAGGVDLYLCGHTHGGQVRLPGIGPLLTSSILGRRYVMGHYHEGRTHLYVSRGVGLEGLSVPRVRLLAPPEISSVILLRD